MRVFNNALFLLLHIFNTRHITKHYLPPLAIQHILSTTKNYKTIATIAVKNYSSAIQYIESDYEHYKDIAIAAITANPSAKKHIKNSDAILAETSSDNQTPEKSLFSRLSRLPEDYFNNDISAAIEN